MRDDQQPGRRFGRGAQSAQDQLRKDSERAGAGHTGTLRRNQHVVLVVDDNRASCYSIARTLRAAGFETLQAFAGMEALKLLPSASALVVDIHLPDVDGMELCRLVRAHQGAASMPVVHVSSMYTEAEDVAESLKAGADTFMALPVDPLRLVETLDFLLCRALE